MEDPDNLARTAIPSPASQRRSTAHLLHLCWQCDVFFFDEHSWQDHIRTEQHRRTAHCLNTVNGLLRLERASANIHLLVRRCLRQSLPAIWVKVESFVWSFSVIDSLEVQLVKGIMDPLLKERLIDYFSFTWTPSWLL